MEAAKGTDLPDLLEYLGYSVRRLGSHYHTTREMDSIHIKDRRTWKRYSNGTSGDAITFLQEFCGKGSREAVSYLLEFNGHRARDSSVPRSRPVPPEEKPAVSLPIPNQDQRRVFAYLQKRGIGPKVIRGFIESGLLYGDSLHHNCVFVGRDRRIYREIPGGVRPEGLHRIHQNTRSGEGLERGCSDTLLQINFNWVRSLEGGKSSGENKSFP